jgi:hypothetical protein
MCFFWASVTLCSKGLFKLKPPNYNTPPGGHVERPNMTPPIFERKYMGAEGARLNITPLGAISSAQI